MKKHKAAPQRRRAVHIKSSRLEQEKNLFHVVTRPFLALVWGIVSTTFMFSLLYSLCFYPSRDVCSSPYEWISILPIFDKLLILTVGLPTFITHLLYGFSTNISFNVLELWWFSLSIVSILIAYIIITLVYRFILILRSASSAHAKR